MAKVTLPFPYIRSLPAADQARLKRDFDAVYAAISTTKVYDAYVDPLATVDNTDTRVFRTPFGAIQYVADTLGQTWCNIGYLVPNAGSNPVTVTETGAYGGVNLCYVVLDAIGASVNAGVNGQLAFTGHGFANWDMGGFTDSSKFLRVEIRGISLTNSLAGPAVLFSRAGVEMVAQNCNINVAGHARLPSGAFINCAILGPSLGGTNTYYFDNCDITGTLATETITSTITARNCRLTNLGSVIFQGTSLVLSGCSFTQYSSGTAGTMGTITCNSTSTERVIITSVAEENGFEQGLTLVISAALPFVWLEGVYWSMVVAAPAAATGGAGSASHHIHADCEQTFDITGPANIAVQAKRGGNFLRGTAVTGSVMAAGNANTGTGLSFVGLHDSIISAAFVAYGTPATGIAYSIDGTSSNNIINAEGFGGFPAVSTNASTTTFVIRHDTTFPISGRDSTGDALNKDMLPAWLGGEPAPGVTVIPAPVAASAAFDQRNMVPEWLSQLSGMLVTPTPAPGSAPTGPAGAALTGSYPNPNLAGRNATGDKMDQDMLPILYDAGTGVTVYPAPVVTSSKDILPSVLAPQEGINAVPPPLAMTPDTPAPVRPQTAGTTPGSSGGTNEGYRKALVSYIDKAQNADAALVMTDQVYNGFQIVDGVISAGTLTTLTSAAGLFTAAMTGQRAICPGFIAAGTTVTFVNATTLTLSLAGTAGTALIVDINPLLKTTGVHAKLFTPRDNGGDTSAVLGVQTGGGGAGTFYKSAGLRPAGAVDYSLSPQGAVEAFTDGGSQAVIAISGGTIFGISGFRSAAVYARIDNTVSDGVLVAPNDAVMDKRLAFVIGNKNINAAPTGQTYSVKLDGELFTKGLAQAGGLAITPAIEAATGMQTIPPTPPSAAGYVTRGQVVALVNGVFIP